ncbi:T-cell surface glycoprotein CD1b-3-like isoform X2 [Silurus meridionalis]|uniref:T-cell surface glycoprotein CD1b-3-like isoform X2 n=1 Tax=Silurus meridionalis TaxID=175797 RepID=UPI001EE9BF88|nr:T-cell surface glycoprotein CD1b-3-like isoform X2 [Silurus meridionalis]
MKILHILLNLPMFLASANAGSHSLCSVATFIIGNSPFPEFIVLIMLDDIIVSYYDSDKQTTVMRVNRAINDEEQEFSKMIFGALYEEMRARAYLLKEHFNCSEGVHVEQRLECCKLLDNNMQGEMKMIDAFDGLSGFEMDYNIHQHSLHTDVQWPLSFGTIKYEYAKALYLHFLQPLCSKALNILLKDLRNYALRKVKPRLRLLKQLNSQSGAFRLTCLATGFYPRHVNVMLLKDNQSMPEHLFTVQGPLPNADGTYQIRKTIEISEDELQQQHNFTCMATHLSQDNKMDVYWEMLITDSRPGPNVTLIIIIVLFMCVITPTAALLLWKRSFSTILSDGLLYCLEHGGRDLCKVG